MKRTVLSLMVCSMLGPLPAADANGQRPLENCAVERHYARALAVEAARTTREVAAGLPRQSARLLHSVPAARLATSTGNIVDTEIFGTLAARGVQPAADATDEEFCRRVSLDLTGLSPSPERLLAYVASTDPGKKAAYVDELMASTAFIDRWTNWFGDLTRSSVTGGTEYVLNRNSEYMYLRAAISANRPVDQIARDYISFTGRYDAGPSGFLPRATYQIDLWQDRYDEMAIETSRAFLGMQISCISCHDGAGHLEGINLYLAEKKRKDFWRVAAFFAQTDFDWHERDDSGRDWNVIRKQSGQYLAATENGQGTRPARKGGVIGPSFKLLGKGKPKGAEDPRVAMAKLVVAHPQFSRAFVNRMFAHFFTIGLVEPLDGFDLARLDADVQLPAGWSPQPSHPKLLADLAVAFQQGGYDMRALMRTIVLSRAYGLSSRYDESAWNEGYARLFARKLARRLEAEEVYDGLVAATGFPAVFRADRFDTTFGSTMALPGPTEPYYERDHQGYDNPGRVRGFLDAFGRGDRFVTNRSSRATVGQALLLMNDWAIFERLYANEGLAARLGADLGAGRITPAQAVEAMYLATLARRPAAAELDVVSARIRDRNDLENLQWALLNRVDFLFNY